MELGLDLRFNEPQFLIEQGRLVDTNVEGVVVKGSGHWLMEEAPDQVIPALVKFLNK
jgi:pimeloyl-ACP methyl ester carboxylesterase